MAQHRAGAPAHPRILAQPESYFSIVQCKVLTPNDFHDLDAVEDRLLAFQIHYEKSGAPFEWKFTRADPNDLLRRLDARDELTPAS